MTSALQTKFATTRADLSSCLLEREGEIDMVLTALLCGEHALLVGPPGTAKSMLSDTMASWVNTERFSVLFNRYTSPEEVFGPVSLSGLKADEYRRVVDNTLITCGVAFLDEIFKASSAILNTTLKVLNERTFRNGKTEIKCPLELAIAASNEWPTEAKELAALFDRFLFRKEVHPVQQESNIQRLMYDIDLEPKLTTTLSMDELTKAREEARKLTVTEAAKDAMRDIRKEVEAQGVRVGDRRRRKSVPAIQAFAWLNGESEVTTDSLEILKDLWWVEPTEQPKVVGDIIGKIAKPSRLIVAQLLGDAQQVERDCKAEDLEQAAVACKKLADIRGKLNKMTSDRSKEAVAKVGEMIMAIKTKGIESTW
jgi:MoxR-like ATPase